MKHVLISILSIFTAVICTACSFVQPKPTQNPTLNLLPETTAPTQSTQDTTPTQQSPVQIELPLVAVALPTTTQTITAQDGIAIFQHTFQNITLYTENTAVIESITQLFTEEMDKSAEAANDVYIKAQDEYNAQQDWTPYIYHTSYSPMRIDRVILSLFGSHIVYEGNAHPYDSRNSITYSMITGTQLTLQQILEPTCTDKQLATLITDALSVYGDTLYGDYPYIVEDCLRGLKGKIENWYLSDTGLCFYFAPYEIAPYSAGVVTAEIPYEQLPGILSDEFFPPESPNVAGEITITPLKDVAPGQITEYVEVILDETQDTFVLDTNGSLLRVKLELGKLGDTSFLKESTVFFAESITTGIGIALQIPMEADECVLKLSYISAGVEKSCYLVSNGSALHMIEF